MNEIAVQIITKFDRYMHKNTCKKYKSVVKLTQKMNQIYF